MKFSEVKNVLSNLEEVRFQLPNGERVPKHFHVTEIGLIQKRFIDCGGTVRDESVINFQLWHSIDYHHRLGAEKLISIMELSERTLGLDDLEVEVEYQSDTIGKYALSFDGEGFRLESKQTDCLAKDNCGIPVIKPKKILSELQNQTSCCTPGGGCC